MYCVSTPPEFGDTLFASTIDAFDALEPSRAAAALSYRAAHSYAYLHNSFKRFTSATTSDASHTAASGKGGEVGAAVGECVPQPHVPSPSAAPQQTGAAGDADADADAPAAASPLLSAERESAMARPALHPLAPIHRASNRRCLYLAPHAIAALEGIDGHPQ